jgi:hypothetical protein
MASARESHWICAGPGFWILAAPADSFLRISSLPSIADGQNQHDVVVRPPSLEGEERLTSARNHQGRAIRERLDEEALAIFDL